VSPELSLKLNLLTLKYRPKCAFSETIVGFRWYTNGKYCLSENSFLMGQFPQDDKKESFKEDTLPKEVWA
jgi:hypothetical protein